MSRSGKKHSIPFKDQDQFDTLTFCHFWLQTLYGRLSSGIQLMLDARYLTRAVVLWVGSKRRVAGGSQLLSLCSLHANFLTLSVLLALKAAQVIQGIFWLSLSTLEIIYS